MCGEHRLVIKLPEAIKYTNEVTKKQCPLTCDLHSLELLTKLSLTVPYYPINIVTRNKKALVTSNENIHSKHWKIDHVENLVLNRISIVVNSL